MAVFTSTFMTQGVGAIWMQALDHWSAFWRSATSSLTFTLTTANGCRALLINRTTAVDTFNYTFVASDIAAAATCSLREISKSPGWRARPNYEEALAGGGTAMRDAWRSKVVALRRAIWSTWGGAALGTQQSETILCEAAQFNGFVDYWRMSRGYEVMVDALLIYGWINAASVNFEAGKGPCDALDTAAAPAGIDLSGVVEQLTEANNKTVDISLNNGAVVVSSAGGVVV